MTLMIPARRNCVTCNATGYVYKPHCMWCEAEFPDSNVSNPLPCGHIKHIDFSETAVCPDCHAFGYHRVLLEVLDIPDGRSLVVAG